MKLTLRSRKKFGIAIALFAFIPFWLGLLAPQLLALPRDFSFRADVVSVDNFYDVDSEAYTGAQYTKTDYGYKTVGHEKGVSLIENYFSVRTTEDAPIFEVKREYAIDRITGEHVYELGDAEREGYLFAPKDLQVGETFTYWNVNYDGPARMEYVKEESLYGLRVFHYQTRYRGVRIDQTSNLSHLPGVGEELGIDLEPHLEIWVEPQTGRLVKYQDDTVAYYYDLESGERLYPWNNFSNTFREESVKANVTSALWAKTFDLFAELYLPALFFILGIFLLISAYTKPGFWAKNLSSRVVSHVTGGLIISISLLIFVGWVFNYEPFIRLLPSSSLSTTNPLTALCFLVIGIMIAFSPWCKPRHCFMSSTFLMTVTGIRMATLYTPELFQIDELLFPERVMAFNSHTSLFSSIGIFLLGVSIFSAKVKTLKSLKLNEILAMSVIILAFVAILGYVVRPFNILLFPLFVNTSLSTAILMLFAGTMLLYLHLQRRKKNSESLAARGLIFLVLAITLSTSIFITSLLEQTFFLDAEARFESIVDRRAQDIEDRMDIYVNALTGVRGLLSASDFVSREEWKNYVDALDVQNNYPGIQGIGYTIFVDAYERLEHEASIRSEGFPEYEIHPVGIRDPYTAIIYLEPFDERNRQAFGFDMYQEPTRRAAMQQARDNNEARLSGRITLVQEIDDDVQAGFLVYVPYYKKSADLDTLEGRRDGIVGYSYSPFRARNFVEGIIGKGGIEDIGLTIYDGALRNDDKSLYSDAEGKFDEHKVSRFIQTRTLFLAGRPWTLVFNSAPDYGATTFSKLTPFLSLFVGIVMSTLVTLIFYTLISARKRAVDYANEVTRNLRSAKAKDEAILESLGEGLIVTDASGKILLVNTAFEHILGFKYEDVKGKALSKVIEMYDQNGRRISDSRRPISKTIGQKKRVRDHKNNFQYKDKNGHLVPIAITVSPVRIKGKLVGAVEVFRDITREQAADKAKTEFVSLASHQLRTPLSAIKWYAEILLSGDAGKLKKEQQTYVDEIFSGNERMIELVNALLDASRLEMGTLVFESEPSDAAKIAKGLLKDLKHDILSRDLKVKTRFAKSTPMVKLSPKNLTMVLQNLLSNAVKYSKDEGAIHVSIEKVKGKKAVQIVVKDNGIGIPEKEQRHIFQRMFRAANAKTSEAVGTGLGLYIAKSVVEKIGGKLWFESKEGEGTSFYVELPMA